MDIFRLIKTLLLDGDPNWCCGTNEFEFQHLLTKKYISGQLIVDWMCGRVKVIYKLSLFA